MRKNNLEWEDTPFEYIEMSLKPNYPDEKWAMNVEKSIKRAGTIAIQNSVLRVRWVEDS